MSVERLREWRDAHARVAELEGAPMFLGKPEAWFEDVHWFCANGHVSAVFLKSDDDLCLACHEKVLMGPAMTEEQFGPIAEFLRQEET